jgi:hypothetical protein
VDERGAAALLAVELDGTRRAGFMCVFCRCYVCYVRMHALHVCVYVWACIHVWLIGAAGRFFVGSSGCCLIFFFVYVYVGVFFWCALVV